MDVSGEAVGAMQAYLRLKRYILPSGVAREALQAALPFIALPSAARELALEALNIAYASMEGSCSANHRIAMNTVDAAIRALSSPDHADAGRVEGDGPTACVGEMQTSSGADYYVCVKVGDREITPHMFKERWKAEYEVAEWLWLFNGGDKPDLLAYGPLPSAPASEGAE